MEFGNGLLDGSRVAAYVRDSGGKDQELSVSQQVESISSWCHDRNLALTRIFSDEARSGTKVAGRDGFLEMMDHFRNEPAEKGLVIWEYSRISRDFDDFQYFVSDLRRRGVVIASVMDHLPEGLLGKAVEGLVVWKNAQFIEDLRRNVRRGMSYVVENLGLPPGTRCPIGYRTVQVEVGKHRDGKPRMLPKMLVDTSYAPRIKRAFDLRARGHTYKEIDAEVHLGKWLSLYRYVLNNPIYMGVYRYEGKLYDNFVEPIVDRETWELVQVVNADRASRFSYNKPGSVRSRYILSGIVYCGKCGQPMSASGTTRRASGKVYEYYKCQSANNQGTPCGNGGARKEVLEQRVLFEMKSRIFTPSFLAEIYQAVQEEYAQTNSGRSEALTRLENELAAVRLSIDRMVSAIAETGHSSAMLVELKRLEQKQAELESSIVDMRHEIKPLPEIDFDKVASTIQEALQLNEPQVDRDIVHDFVSRIDLLVAGGQITGKMTFSLPDVVGESVINL